DLHEYFRIQFEGQYVQKGAEFTDEAVLDVTAEISLDYIEFMVPFTLTIPTNSAIAPRLYAGPALGIEVSCNLSVEGGGLDESADCDEDADASARKSTDFSVFFGGGVDIAVGSGAITLDVLYDLGLSSIDDTPGEDIDVKNKALLVLAGYRFFFGS
ncbi:MAG: outer membrane beta-barrel protein, partial [Gemmatimonadota bacterium]